jgi:hypothetical protein
MLVSEVVCSNPRKNPNMESINAIAQMRVVLFQIRTAPWEKKLV